MPLFTACFPARAISGGALVPVGLAFTSQAPNTPPAWQSAANIGPKTFNTGVGAVDAAGNHYVLGAGRGSATAEQQHNRSAGARVAGAVVVLGPPNACLFLVFSCK